MKIELTHAQVMAIWWHDAVYVPYADDNEQKSINLMFDTNKYASRDTHNLIRLMDAKELILATKLHDPATTDATLVCDLDMFIFAENDDLYFKYEAGICSEFILSQPELMPKEYVAGRIKFLRSLQHRSIFYHSAFKQFEVKAQERISKQLEILES